MTKSSPGNAADSTLEALELESREDRKTLRWALIAAVLAHAILLSVTFPEIAARTRRPSEPRTVFVVQQSRFKLPPPKPPKSQQVPKPRKKRIPIPDPTPDDPEPIFMPEVDVPEIEALEIDIGAVFGIPEGPPVGVGATGGRSPLHLGGAVKPPVGVYTPQPRYSEEAREARVQGVVLLQSVIDEEGDVTRLEVLKGLPLGLTASALDTVRTWKYQPATLNGEPVPVYFHLMVRFSVQ